MVGRLMPFQKGNKYGGGNRTKEQLEFEKKCRAYMMEKGWPALIEMAEDKEKRVRQWALEQLMMRGFGRPKETIDVTTRDEAPREPDELASEIAELISGEAGEGKGINPGSQAVDGAGAAKVLPPQSGPTSLH